MAASSSSSGLRWKYDVFINFRGEDTRRGFVSHLYKALRQKPINTFIDSEELRKGDRLSELLTAIRESRLSIVVFSKQYANSTWCLKELVEILECHHTKNQIVLPIFYEVDPSDIRKLKRSFAEAFAQHENDSSAEMEEVQSWRSALTTATCLSGWDSRNYEDDAKLIEEIVEDVYRKLIPISSTSSKDDELVEMDSHMREMHSRLQLDPSGVELGDVRVVGIWGMGGLGKTTIARAVFDEIACQFQACCFLENVKEGFMKHGELYMQTQLLSSISSNKVGSSDILAKGFQVMLKSLGQRKVLLVVDDVDKLAQIEALLGNKGSFGGGSRIIITTRDLQILDNKDAIYKPKIFSDPKALELFRRYAFRTNQPTRDYDDLTRRAVNYAQGLPLALKVLGASLYNKTIREWKGVLEKLKEVPQRRINDVLRTSFDELDCKEKNIFLDIACFFKGMKEDHATEILDSCGFYPHAGIRVLIDRALITISVNGELGMHDLIEEMGREIVRQESIEEPGRQSRLWSYEDLYRVLAQNTATKAVESIILDLSCSYGVCLNVEALASMTQLRLLKISHKYSNFRHDYYKQHLIGNLKFLSRELRCLLWSGFPLKSLPSNCQFKNLVDLDMQHSLIDRLWEGTQTLEKLKFINLSYCQYLKETPDFTKMPNLKKLILEMCIRLVEVHTSIWAHMNLVLLSLNGCKELKIHVSIMRMKSLKTLDIHRCLSLEMFPEIPEVMEELSVLDLSRSKIKELPSSINNFTGLGRLLLRDCKELKSLPSSICQLKSLEYLYLSGCTKFEVFPSIEKNMGGLKELHLDGTSIKELPPSIERLQGLEYLNLRNCKSLEMFPEISEVMEELSWLNLSRSKIKELPSSINNNLTGLEYLDLKDCKELKSLPNIIRMKSLKTLDLCGCSSLEMFPEISEVMEKLSWLSLSGSKIKELPSSINNLTGLEYLDLTDCKELKRLPTSICMKSLENFNLCGCSSLEMFPEISEVMEKLSLLDLSGSKMKELPSSINNLTGLEYLDLKDCKELKSLPNIIRMKSLKSLDLCGCSSLEMFTEISEVMEKLSWLSLSGSRIKELPPLINNLTGLKYLDLKDCKELKSLPSNIPMKSLENFNLCGCSSLEMFPEISEVMEKLSSLDLSESKIKELPSSINNLTRLEHLYLKDCKELKSLLSSIHMKCLKALYLCGCSSLEMFPEILEVMEELSWLDLSGSKIKELPLSINNLTRLEYLYLKDCKELKSLPRSIPMKSLKTLNLCGCSSLEMFPEISEVMEELSWLDLSGSKIKELPSSINNLTGLEYLDLKDCKELKSLPNIIRMKSLKTLDLCGCSSLEMFPEISEVMEKLSWLSLSGSKIKELPSSINNLTGLEYLDLTDCKELKRLPTSICMKSLENFNLFGCSSLEMFSEISEVMEKLSSLILSGSKIKELSPSINNLTGLEYLILTDCKELINLPSTVCQRKSLRYVSLSGCTQFEVFPSIEENMVGLRELHLDGTSIKELCPSIERLQGLEYLNLRNCKSLVHLPETLSNLAHRDALNLCGCPNL